MRGLAINCTPDVHVLRVGLDGSLAESVAFTINNHYLSVELAWGTPDIDRLYLGAGVLKSRLYLAVKR